MQLTWVGFTAIWLSSAGLLPVLAMRERVERQIVQAALWVALAALLAVPPL